MTPFRAHGAAALPSAAEIAADVRAGRRTAADVVAEHRDRAEQHAGLNAFISQDWDAALARARELDRRRSRGDDLGPLAGVPLSVKDVIAVAGFPATLGSVAFAANRAEATASAVQRLLDADAIAVGKTNLPEFAFGTTCDNELAGVTLNPLDPSRSPGGSSGGEAAAVASGMSSLGVGTDYGGSLRWPAACTGIAALRPTAGRIADDGTLPGAAGDVSGRTPPDATRMQSRYQVVGPLARSVRDLALAFDVLCPEGDDRGEAQAPRIGWTAGLELGPVRTEMITVLAGAAAALDAVEVGTRLSDSLHAYNAYRALDPLNDHLEAVRGREGLVSPGALAALSASTGASVADLAAAREHADAVRTNALRLFRDVDVLLLPVAGGPACLPDGSLDVDGEQVSGWNLMAHCRAVTLLGAPSVSVPVGVSAEGLPLSIQVVAAPGHDRMALAVAGML